MTTDQRITPQELAQMKAEAEAHPPGNFLLIFPAEQLRLIREVELLTEERDGMREAMKRNKIETDIYVEKLRAVLRDINLKLSGYMDDIDVTLAKTKP